MEVALVAGEAEVEEMAGQQPAGAARALAELTHSCLRQRQTKRRDLLLLPPMLTLLWQELHSPGGSRAGFAKAGQLHRRRRQRRRKLWRC